MSEIERITDGLASSHDDFGDENVPPVIHAIDVSKTYADGTEALRSIGLTVDHGELLAIIGPSGSGKSSLLNLLGLLDTASGGHLTISGCDVNRLTNRDKDLVRSREIGFVFQSAHVLGDESVLTNAAMGLQVRGVPFPKRQRIAAGLLATVGLDHKIDSPARLLSGGERQRLAVARALANRPKLILADEPTGSLDSDNGRVILRLLDDARRDGTTVIVITHDPHVAAFADRTVEIRDGRLIDKRAIPKTVGPSESSAGHVDRSAPNTTSTIQNVESTEAESDSTFASEQPEGRARWGRLGDLLIDAISALSTRSLRTALLVIAFGLGIGGLLVSLGIGMSVAQQVDTRLQNASLDHVEAVADFSSVRSGGEVTAVDEQEVVEGQETLLRLPHVRAVGYWSYIEPSDAGVTPGWKQPGPEGGDVGVMIASREYLELATNGSATSARVLNLDRPIALISTNAAEKLGLPSGSDGWLAGAQVWVRGKLVDVVGVVETDPMHPELFNSVIVNEAAFGALPQTINYSIITDMGYPASIAEVVPRVLSPSDPHRVTVATTADLSSLRTEISSDLAGLVAVLSSVLLALVCLSAATVMYLSVNSRTAEIALRRALGLSRRATAIQFLLEGAMIGCIGGALAIAVGIAGVIVLGTIQEWSPVVNPWTVPYGVALGVVTGLISAAYPAWAASRKDPAIALRE